MKKAGPSSIAVSMTHPMIIAPKASAIPTAKLASVAKKIVFLAPSIVQKIKGKKDFGGELEAFANGLIIFEKKIHFESSIPIKPPDCLFQKEW